MKRSIVPIALGSLLLGMLFDFFFYGKMPGVSIVLFLSLILSVTFYLTRIYAVKIPRQVLAIAPLGLFFALMVCVRASGFLAFLNIVMVMYLLLLIYQLLTHADTKLQDYTLANYVKTTLPLPFQFIRQFLTLLKTILKQTKETKPKKHQVAPIVRGVILSIPFLIVFLLLFSSADLVFKQYIGSIFSFNISSDVISHLIVIGLVVSAFIGAYTLMFTENKSHASLQKQSAPKDLGSTEAFIVAGSVATLFFVFVVIQFAYLFGGGNHVAASTFTYSEYARKGFFELIVVAIITLLLLLVLNRSTIRNSLKQQVTFMWLSMTLIAEVLVIMLSAAKRLGLYEQAYGFTTSRLYSHLFIGWLAVVFVVLLVTILREQSENKFAFHVFLSVIVFLGVVNVINPDAMVARQNIQRFKSTGKIDVMYLGSLSEDATPTIAKLLQDPNEKLQKAVAWNLNGKKQSQVESPGWQSFNIARHSARQILDSNSAQLYANKDYQFDGSQLE